MMSILTRIHQWRILAYNHLHFLGLNPRFWFEFRTDMLCTCTALRPTTLQKRVRSRASSHQERMERVLKRATLMIPNTSDGVDDKQLQSIMSLEWNTISRPWFTTSL